MSNFECSVKDLMSNTGSISGNSNENENENENLESNNSEENVPIPTQKPHDVNLSVYQRLYTDKNIKTILFITLVYLVLNSDQMYTFLSNNASFLLIEGSPGFLGRAAIGLMLGITLIVFTSFFSF